MPMWRGKCKILDPGLGRVRIHGADKSHLTGSQGLSERWNACVCCEP